MSGALFHIGLSGVSASRASLELTAQNIANSSNAKYTRRTLEQSELVASASLGLQGSHAYGGVTPGAVRRTENELLQLQVRRATSDLALADAQMNAMEGAETALERSRVFESLTEFEAQLLRLEGNPTDPTLRTATLESAREMTGTFRLASGSLGDARSAVTLEIGGGINTVNSLTAELGRINTRLPGALEGSATRAALLDARDAALRDLSKQAGIAAEFDRFGAARVTITGTPDVTLVDGASTAQLSFSQDAQGRVTYLADGTAFAPASGAMAGRALALDDIAGAQSDLDALAARVIAIGNAAQAAGSALDGSAGQPLFSGSRASDFGIALASGAGLATAPAGSPAGSRNTANLGNLIATFAAKDGPAADADALLLGMSTRISAIGTRREGLAIIAQGAEAALLSETGVDLDAEAAALVRLQQAFEANSRVIQVATRIFDTILGLN